MRSPNSIPPHSTRRTRSRPGALVATLVLVGLSTLSVTTAEAQPGGRERPGWRMGGPRTGRPLAGLPLRQLELTDTQRQVVRAVMTQHRASARDARRQLRTAQRALDDAVTTIGTPEARIRELSGRVAALETDAAVARASLLAQVWAVLTPEQRERADAIRAQRAERREDRRRRMEQRRERRGPRGGRGAAEDDADRSEPDR